MHFNDIVIETTYVCNARCAHCYTSCGPDASHQILSQKIACKVLDEAAEDDRVEKNLTIAGGESTLYWNHLISLLNYATKRGYYLSLVTNAYWGVDPRVASQRCKDLASSGLSRIEISTDIFHEPYILSSAVGHTIEAARDAGLDVYLRLAVTKSSTVGDIIYRFKDFDLNSVLIVPQVTSPSGRGKSLPLAELYLGETVPCGNCAELLNLTVTPSGDVFPCCAGSELSPFLCMGNCKEATITQIIDYAERNMLIQKLVNLGPATLLTTLDPHLAQRVAGRKFAHICDLCNSLFADKDIATALAQNAEDQKREAINSILRASRGEKSNNER